MGDLDCVSYSSTVGLLNGIKICTNFDDMTWSTERKGKCKKTEMKDEATLWETQIFPKQYEEKLK